MSARPLDTDYLLDTSVLSRLLDGTDPDHTKVRAWAAALPPQNRKLLSVVALAELRFGLELARAAQRPVVLVRVEEIIRKASQYDSLEITKATASEYAGLKAAIVAKFLPNRLRQRPKGKWGNPEDWTDEFTGRLLRTQENDVWQCAQAIERDLTFVSCDNGVDAIEEASQGKLKLLRLHQTR